MHAYHFLLTLPDHVAILSLPRKAIPAHKTATDYTTDDGIDWHPNRIVLRVLYLNPITLPSKTLTCVFAGQTSPLVVISETM